jgi:hypothetical protein
MELDLCVLWALISLETQSNHKSPLFLGCINSYAIDLSDTMQCEDSVLAVPSCIDKVLSDWLLHRVIIFYI